MENLTLLEKAEMFKRKVCNLCNSNYNDILDIALLDGLLKNADKPKTIKMSSSDLIRFTYNTNNHMNNGGEIYYLLDKETICKIVNEIQEDKSEAIHRACEKIRDQAIETKAEADLSFMQKQIAVLEDELYRISLAKAIIVPTDNLYRSKEEYDNLRKHLNETHAEMESWRNKAWKLAQENKDLNCRIVEIISKLGADDLDKLKERVCRKYDLRLCDEAFEQIYQQYLNTATQEDKELRKELVLKKMIPLARQTVAKSLKTDEMSLESLSLEELIISPVFELFLKHEMLFYFEMGF